MLKMTLQARRRMQFRHKETLRTLLLESSTKKPHTLDDRCTTNFIKTLSPSTIKRPLLVNKEGGVGGGGGGGVYVHARGVYQNR